MNLIIGGPNVIHLNEISWMSVNLIFCKCHFCGKNCESKYFEIFSECYSFYQFIFLHDVSRESWYCPLSNGRNNSIL